MQNILNNLVNMNKLNASNSSDEDIIEIEADDTTNIGKCNILLKPKFIKEI